MHELETDYLVVGAGASGMAFTDALIAGGDAEVVMVERRNDPGGHWTVAYPFVRIHHTSSCYGVNSIPLGQDTIDDTGLSAGMYERGEAREICAHFRRALEDVLLPSGQVRYFGMCDYVGDWEDDHAFVSRVNGKKTTVRVRKKIVDTTYLDVTVPATHKPAFSIDPDAPFITPGHLVDITQRPSGYTVVGGGKTGMDTVIWLLEHGEDPERIRWIKPRDCWMIDRMCMQPLDLVAESVEGFSNGIETLAAAESVDDLWPRVEATGLLARPNSDVLPTMFKGAIVSAAERDKLGEVENVVQMGRIKKLGTDRIVLAEGEISTDRKQLHIDCTATAFRSAPEIPIFGPKRITLQSMVGGFTTYYAALIGFIESTARDDEAKNRLCPPCAQVGVPIDWVKVLRGVLRTAALHGAEPDVTAWQGDSRLNITRDAAKHLDNPRVQAGLARWEANAEQALANSERFLADAGL